MNRVVQKTYDIVVIGGGPGGIPAAVAAARRGHKVLLLFLVQNKGKVFSIDQIYEQIWKEEAYGADNTVTVHIRHIREKIEIDPKNPKYLKVIWGVGYKVENL